MILSVPQRRLLDAILARERVGSGRLVCRGNRLRTARSLERMGLAVVSIEGTAWASPWWYEVAATEKGRNL